MFKDLTEEDHYHYVKYDYMGIVIMIAGTSIVPYYYALYCDEVSLYRNLFIGFIILVCSLTFLVIMTPKYSSNEGMKLRGILFLSCGFAILLPAIYTEFFLDPLYLDDFIFTPWAFGGAIYVIGAIIYMFKIPEKFFPGKFDIIG